MSSHAPRGDPSPGPAGPGRGVGPTVLLAEDDREMRRLLASLLRRDGHQVIEATTGEEALGHLGASGLLGVGGPLPDVLVMDVAMPGISGLNVLRAVREGGCRVPVVLITAFGEVSLHDAARRLGAWGVLDKPFEADALRAAVWDALGREPARGV